MPPLIADAACRARSAPLPHSGLALAPSQGALAAPEVSTDVYFSDGSVYMLA
jgi:hypothetical protein